MERISHRQAISILVIFIFGSTIIVGVNSAVGQDSWLAQLGSAVFALPILMVYARLVRLFPEKNLYDIFLILFGKIGGRLLVLVFTWYAMHLGGIVLRNFTAFLQIAVMPETPQLAFVLVIFIVIAYLVKSGIETLGKYALVVMPIPISVAILTTLLALNQMDLSDVLPIFGHSLGEIGSSAYKGLTFPYGETVLFLCVADALNKKDNPYKIYFYSLLISSVILIIIVLRNIDLLGPAMLGAEYFPSYVAVKLIKVGDLLQRIEGSLSMSFILVGTVKVAVCVLAASKGAASLFNISNYRQLVLPVGLLAISISAIAYDNVMEMFDFLNYYQYYVIPFQFVIPIGVWITAEIKKRNGSLPQSA